MINKYSDQSPEEMERIRNDVDKFIGQSKISHANLKELEITIM
jgi:hypothetical protein